MGALLPLTIKGALETKINAVKNNITLKSTCNLTIKLVGGLKQGWRSLSKGLRPIPCPGLQIRGTRQGFGVRYTYSY